MKDLPTLLYEDGYLTEETLKKVYSLKSEKPFRPFEKIHVDASLATEVDIAMCMEKIKMMSEAEKTKPERS